MMVYKTVATLNTEDQWEEINADDFENVLVTIEGTWTGDIEFWGTNDETSFDVDYNWVKWSLNDSTGVSSTTLVSTVAGTSPTEIIKGFRGSIAGCRAFAVYAASGFTGTARVVISIHRSSK
jgi:hypothetical protein